MGSCLSRRHTTTLPPRRDLHTSSSSSSSLAAAATTSNRISIITDLYNDVSNQNARPTDDWPDIRASSSRPHTAAVAVDATSVHSEPRINSSSYYVDGGHSGIGGRQDGDGRARDSPDQIFADAVNGVICRHEWATYATSESCAAAEANVTHGWSLLNIGIVCSMLLAVFVAWLMMKLVY